jgi:MYND finger
MARRGGKYKKTTKALSDNMAAMILKEAEAMSATNVSQEVARLEQERRRAFHNNPLDQIPYIKSMIAVTGTEDVDQQNQRDPLGNGDQTPLTSEEQAQVFRNLWQDGFDMDTCLFHNLYPPFTKKCILGDVMAVSRLLTAAAPHEKQVLLETRSSTFRCTPLILTIGFAKYANLIQQQVQGNHPIDPEGVARVLLRHGANPNVKDIAGKTAVHWGAGSFCTPNTRKIAGWCMEAAKSCHHVGETVTVQGLSNTRYNNRTGILGGYDVDSQRRIVHVHHHADEPSGGEEKEILLQPKNVFFLEECIYRDKYNLVDVQDRLLAVALHEVVMGGEKETAKFLCHTHHASVDVMDLSGTTPRWMSLQYYGGMETDALRLVKAYSCSVGLAETCSRCGRISSTGLSKCSGCGESWYCNRSCQRAHWPEHKLLCKPKTKPIVLDRPRGWDGFGYTTSRDGVFENAGYTKPRRVAMNEDFRVKIQRCMTQDQGPLLLYDEKRQCQFHIWPSTRGYDELTKYILAEKASHGTKTHFNARFNENDDMLIYPGSAKLLTW